MSVEVTNHINSPTIPDPSRWFVFNLIAVYFALSMALLTPPMMTIANILIVLVALLHLYFLVLEMFLWTRPTGRNVGRITFDDTASARYLNHLLASVSTPLTGLKIVVDCANGASSLVAPHVYE